MFTSCKAAGGIVAIFGLDYVLSSYYSYSYMQSVKGTVHPKNKILASFIHPYVAPNVYDFLSSLVKNDDRIKLSS